jgi:hypothetical protein
MLLIVPGRIGTSSPELGVTVTYAQISQFRAICEVSSQTAGYQPELSFGSHMFQDLVEAEIFYGAIFEDSRTRLYQPELLAKLGNDLYPGLFGADDAMAGLIALYDVSAEGLTLTYDLVSGRAACVFAG